MRREDEIRQDETRHDKKRQDKTRHDTIRKTPNRKAIGRQNNTKAMVIARTWQVETRQGKAKIEKTHITGQMAMAGPDIGPRFFGSVATPFTNNTANVDSCRN